MKRFINTSSPPGFAALLAGAAILGLLSQSTLAAVTPSGTSITNLAKISYKVGTVDQPEICSSPTGNSTGNGGTTGTTCTTGSNGALSTSFTVDNKVNVTVAGGVITPVTPGETSVVTPFTVTNSGNATQGYNLVAANAASAGYTVNATAITDNFNPVPALQIYLDNNGNGIIDGADAVVTTIPTLAPGATANLLVLTDIASTRLNGDAAVISLKATSVWPTPLVPAEEPTGTTPTAGATVIATAGANTADVDVVFADTVAGVVDATFDGAHSTYGAFKVASAILSVAKSATVICDPINGSTNPKNIPGAAVQYAVTITNATGAASATLTQVTDSLVSTLGFDPKLINGVGAGSLCSSGTGTSLSASGFSAVSGTGTTTTTYASPGTTGQATTAGATEAAGVVTIDFSTLAGGAYGLTGGVLPANSFVTVYFNAFVQ